MKWISCKDQKPKHGQKVLIWLGGGDAYYVATYTQQGDYFTIITRPDRSGLQDINVTDKIYWAELVQPEI